MGAPSIKLKISLTAFDVKNKNLGILHQKYVFTLKVYRDCNGVPASTFTQFLDVWGHPTINQISMNFIGQEDVSPNCNPVISGNPVLSCSNGDVGAVEEYTYESLPINIPGIPPGTGWHFTWDNCCRNELLLI